MRRITADIVRDVRQTFRQLRRAPGFAVVVILTLAVGIGATSAVFSVVNGVLLRPLPYEEPEELVDVSTAFPTLGFEEFWMSPPEFYELREWNQVFDEVGGFRVGSASVETYDRPLRVTSAIATWSLFPTLGVEAALGRVFVEEEDRIGAEPVVVISDGLWDRGFGGDPAVLGRTIRVDGLASTVVGVLPPEFDLQDAGVDVLIPANRAQEIDPRDHVNRRGNHFFEVVARMHDGITLEEARVDLDRMEGRWEREYGSGHAVTAELHPMRAQPLRDDILGDARPALLLLLGAVGFVLLIACANVGSLLLARSERRSREVAVRVAMGADRGRLVRQLLTEGLTLGLLGGIGGLILSQLALDAVLQVNPDPVARADEIRIDGAVLAFTTLVSLGTGLLFGLAPLMGTSLSRLSSVLKEGGTRTTRGVTAVGARQALVVAEVALAVVLLTGGGLMLRSLAALQEVDTGFRSDGLLTGQVSLPEADYPNPADVGRFYDEFLDRVRGLPGVTSASATSALPPAQTLNANDTQFEGVPVTADGPPHNVDYWTAIEDGYLETLEIEVLEGRGFEPRDALAETPVMLVNRRLADTFYPGGSPLGRRIRPPGSDTWFTVVGIVEDTKQSGIAAEPGTELFFYHPQLTRAGLFSYRTMNPVLRVEGNPLALAPAVERIVRELDPALPLSSVQTMQERVGRSLAQPRFLTLLLGIFAAIALVLAAVGTYAVVSYSVAERSREIGIRMAMGARSENVLAMVIRQGGGMAGLGLGLGILGAFGLTRLLGSQLYQVSSSDPGTFVAAPLFLGAVALAACFLPARRATRVDPVTALREE